MPTKLMPYTVLWGLAGAVLGALATLGLIRLGIAAAGFWHLSKIGGGAAFVLAFQRG